jgi:hypothetical protein
LDSELSECLQKSGLQLGKLAHSVKGNLREADAHSANKNLLHQFFAVSSVPTLELQSR